MKATFGEFKDNLVSKMDNQPTAKNVSTLLSRMLEHGSCRLFTISNDINEYNKIQRTITQENSMSTVNPTMINDSLMSNFREKLSDINNVYVIHDPSDIRKPYSTQIENLGKVRDLNGGIINGFSSYNVVAICDSDKKVNLISHMCFSNKDPNFLKVDEIKKLNEGKSFEGDDAARELLDSNEYFNKKTIFTTEMTRISTQIKDKQPQLKLTHILDREFDDEENYKLIDKELGDEFVARAKKSRVTGEKDDKKSVKLIDSEFTNKSERKAQVIQFKDKVYQDATVSIDWRDFNDYKAIRVRITDRNGNEVFKDPMLLFTNKNIKSAEDAYAIYMIYLKRSKIEYVFRFLKEGLGWEEIQLRNFTGVQNLLSLCFYLTAYLYDVGDEIINDDFAILLAELGGGKGKVTRHYIHKGIKMLLTKYRVDNMFVRNDVSKQQEDQMKRLSGIDLALA